MNDFVSVFVGVPQSRYAALAIAIAIAVVSLVILVSKDTIPLGQKFGFLFLIFLVSLPSLALSLFQLTCIVTGAGFNNKRWWCSAYAWIISVVMIFYAVLLVFAAVTSLTAPKPNTLARTLTPEQFNDMMSKANNAANSMMTEGFETSDDNLKLEKDAEEEDEETMNPELFTGGVATFIGANGQKVQGGASVSAPYPGNEGQKLAYAPGAEVNGSALPLPSAPFIESFYSPANFSQKK